MYSVFSLSFFFPWDMRFTSHHLPIPPLIVDFKLSWKNIRKYPHP
jgi:hypothetical protein